MITKDFIYYFLSCLEASYTHTKCDGDYAIQVKDGELLLMFEWSDGKEDWLNNFNFPVKPYKHMEETWYCHGGFLKVWKAIHDEVAARVAETLAAHPGIRDIVCIGYSHGAAIAVLATEALRYLFGEKYCIVGIGFGAPRVLWGKVPKDVQERLSTFTTVRVIPDIVTHVPPKCFGFKDAGYVFELGDERGYGPFRAHFPEVYECELIKFREECEA